MALGDGPAFARMFLLFFLVFSIHVIMITVKPVYNDHLGDEVSAVVIDKWSL